VTTLLIRRLRPIGEPARPSGSPALSTLDGLQGAGRIAQALGALGILLEGVTQAVIDAEAPIDALAGIDLGRSVDVVVLGSHLVNAPDEARRGAFVDLAARHAAPGARLFLEHHPLDWAETADAVEATPGGSQLGMIDVRREPPFVSAVSVYDVGGRVERQPFRARVLTDAELDVALRGAGLDRVARRSPTWLEAVSRAT